MARYSKDWASYHYFLDRWLLLINKLLNQRFRVAMLTSLPRRFYSCYPDLVNRCILYVSQMTTCSHVPFLVNTTQSCTNTSVFTWIPARVTPLVSHVEEKMLTIPENKISLPLDFLCRVLCIIVCPLIGHCLVCPTIYSYCISLFCHTTCLRSI